MANKINKTDKVSSGNRATVNSSAIDLVGNTPIVKINNITKDLPENVVIYAKLEGYNPGGSVKDRPALRMITDAEADGRLTKDKIILDSSSGNTGIAYGWIAAVKGYKIDLVVPENVSSERKQMLRAYGVNVIFSSPLEGSDGAIKLSWSLYAETPEKYCKLDQYNNESNVLAHYDTTGVEVFEQTGGKVTHFVATIGTGGTVMGTSKRLKEYNSDIIAIEVEPDNEWHGLEGLKHMDSSIVPGIYNPETLDRKVPAPTEEAYEMVKRLAREEGLLVGQSSGAAMWSALEVAKELASEGKSGHIVVMFPDGGDKYLSTRVWD